MLVRANEESYMTSTIPEAFTPDQLREEAARRELRDRAKWVADRRSARNKVVDALLALDKADVRASGASEALKMALGRLSAMDEADQEKEPTNGDINLASSRGPDRDKWWDAVRQQVPHVDQHPMLDKNRAPSW